MQFGRPLKFGILTVLTLTLGALAAHADDRAAREKVVSAIKADRDGSIERLRAWIALPTIANMGVNTPQGAQYMRQLALDSGFQQARIVETGGVPGVFATLDAGAKHTLAVYFMYDVKHFDPAEWSSPPLAGKLVDRPGEGKALVGRGAVNQKGPEMAFLTALHAFKEARVKLPVNLVLVAEGEEEIGSTNFPKMLADPEVAAALKRSVGVVMPSSDQSRDGSVSIDLGAKGVIEVQLVSSGETWGRGPAKDIHSSLMARVDSPAWRLVKALDTLVADDGFTPAIDGWFENVRPLTPHEKELIAADLPKDEESVKQQLGVRHWINDEDFLTSAYRLASQPTVNIQGLVAGYTGPGGKTVLPGRAEAKLDFRLGAEHDQRRGRREAQGAPGQARVQRHPGDRQWWLQSHRVVRRQRNRPGRYRYARQGRRRVQLVSASCGKLARCRVHRSAAADAGRPFRCRPRRRRPRSRRMAADRQQRSQGRRFRATGRDVHRLSVRDRAHRKEALIPAAPGAPARDAATVPSIVNEALEAADVGSACCAPWRIYYDHYNIKPAVSRPTLRGPP